MGLSGAGGPARTSLLEKPPLSVLRCQGKALVLQQLNDLAHACRALAWLQGAQLLQ